MLSWNLIDTWCVLLNALLAVTRACLGAACGAEGHPPASPVEHCCSVGVDWVPPPVSHRAMVAQ